MHAPGAADAMMDEFMQQNAQMGPMSAPSAVAMEQMRRDFEALNTAPQQRNGSPHWAAEFEPAIDDNIRMEAAFQRPKGFSPQEFDRYVQSRQGSMGARTGSPMTSSMNNNMSSMSSWQRPMGLGMGYGGGLGMNNMMSQPFNSMNTMQQPEAQTQGKGKGRMVELDDKDWETQFAQLEQDQSQTDLLDEEANRAMEAELNEINRSVHDKPTTETDRFGDFEDIWKGIKAEMSADLSRNMYDDINDNDMYRNGELNDWADFDGDLNTHLQDPQLGDYLFEQENPFSNLLDPFDEGVRIMDEGGNLSLAALAFEAAVQKNPDHVDAWTRLGAAQAQNEKETPAIRALEQAVKLDPTNSSALMGLAVSYTNEGYDTTAYRTLERWLGSKYPSIAPLPSDPTTRADPLASASDFGFTERHVLHERVTNLFIRAAQLAPTPEAMDPDVQVGLGVLFYGDDKFEKAVDCFGAALASTEAGATNSERGNQRPLLWNRLGATLANSGRSEEAIQAYERALELNPNFVRARYNLGVSCINIGCYEEAAQHLLGALSMHQVSEREGRDKAKEILGDGAGGGNRLDDEELERMLNHNQSTNLYDTLRRVFTHMGRKDLMERVGSGMNVDSFRGEFDF